MAFQLLRAGRQIAGLLALVPALTLAAPGQVMLLPTTTLQIHNQAGRVIPALAELAATPQSRAQGLMYRQQLPADQGMLFVFETAASCFWMRNTLVPLSIAFIDAQGLITRIAHMQPLSEAEHCPDQVLPYALEMNQGWFRRHGIQVGDRISNLPARTPLPQ